MSTRSLISPDDMCGHFDSCSGNHINEASDFFCNHSNSCEMFHPGYDDEEEWLNVDS